MSFGAIEDELFTYSDMLPSGSRSHQFYDVELIRDVGNHRKGEKFDSAIVDVDVSTIYFYNKDLEFCLKINATFEEVKT